MSLRSPAGADGKEKEEECLMIGWGVKLGVLMRWVVTQKIKLEEFNREMAATGSYAPKSPPPATPKGEKWFKLGAVGKKKRVKEGVSFDSSGRDSTLESPTSDTLLELSILERELVEGEERCLVERSVLADDKLGTLINALIDWINDELADDRIIVRSLEDDLFDGQILHKLLEKFTGKKLELPEVSISEENQRQKLELILMETNKVFGLEFPSWAHEKWNVDTLHSKSLVSILHLLVYLARHFNAPIKLPKNVAVEMLVVKKKGNKLEQRREVVQITPENDDSIMAADVPDALDGHLSPLPDKLEIIYKRVLSFANKQLSKISLQVQDVESDFHDGVYLILLLGMLEGYFVPLHLYHLTPKDDEQKLHNVQVSLDLMRDAGIDTWKIRPQDIVHMDPKSTRRLLWTLLIHYKDI